METQTFYLAKLKEALSIRQRNNPHYSLRAYARDIGIHPATLSQIINGKRGLPLKDSDKVASKLNLGPREKVLFTESLKRRKSLEEVPEIDNRVVLNESHYKILAEWEHYAVLELFELENFTPTIESVATRLGLTLNRAEVVMNNLTIAGLVQGEESGRFKKVCEDVTTADDIANQALRDSHKESMLMGLTKLGEVSIELRDFSSLTLAVDPARMPEFKALIRDFRKKMLSLTRQGSRNEVYQLALQFYPLTRTPEPLQ